MLKEVLEFTRPMTLFECGDFADAHREAIATFDWNDPRGSAWFLNDGRGTWQGHICTAGITLHCCRNDFEMYQQPGDCIHPQKSQDYSCGCWQMKN